MFINSNFYFNFYCFKNANYIPFLSLDLRPSILNESISQVPPESLPTYEYDSMKRLQFSLLFPSTFGYHFPSIFSSDYRLHCYHTVINSALIDLACPERQKASSLHLHLSFAFQFFLKHQSSCRPLCARSWLCRWSRV